MFVGFRYSFHSSVSWPTTRTLRPSKCNRRGHNEGRCRPWWSWTPCSVGEGNILLFVLVTIQGASVGRSRAGWHDSTIPPRAGPCLQIVCLIFAPSTPSYTDVSIPPVSGSANADKPQPVRHKGIIEKYCKTCSPYHINEIMMRKVHSRPVENSDIPPGDLAKVGEEMPNEESLERGTGRVERGECTEWDWCA